MSVYNRTDSVFIERLLPGDFGYEQSGIYAMAYRLLDAANQFAMLFAVLLLPIFSRLVKLKERLDQMVRLPFDILISFALILSIGSYFYRFEIMDLLYTINPGETNEAYASRIAEAGEIYGLIMFGFIGTSLMYIFSTLLTANGNLLQLNLIAAAGIALNFTLNISLVPLLEAKGAAISCLTTQLFTGVAYAIAVQFRFRFKINLRYLLKVLAYIIGVLLFTIISVELPVHWIVGLLILVIASLILAIALKLINISGFVEIIKTKDSL
jgi:O-antigen/teichoic acid export membrane protein